MRNIDMTRALHGLMGYGSGMTNGLQAGRSFVKRTVMLPLVFMTHGFIASGQQGGGAAAATTAAYTPTMTFDVASIRESKKADSFTVSGWLDPHTSALRLQNNSMSNLIIDAYGIQRYQIVGLPDWPFPTMFTIVDKSDHGADEKLAKLRYEDALLEKQHMLQALLAERFKLKTHWETRQGAAYNLVVAKPGRLHEAKGGPSSAEDTKEWGEQPIPTFYQKNDGREFDYIAHGAPWARSRRCLAFGWEAR